jgi:hypothetical protein
VGNLRLGYEAARFTIWENDLVDMWKVLVDPQLKGLQISLNIWIFIL